MKLNIKTSTPLLIYRCLDASAMIGDHTVDHHLNFLLENTNEPQLAESIVQRYRELFDLMKVDSIKFKQLFEDSIFGFEKSSVSDDFKDLYKDFSELNLLNLEPVIHHLRL